MGAWAVSNVVIYAHRERIGLLKYHSDLPAEFIYIGFGSKNIFTVIGYVTGYFDAGNQIIHTIKGFKKGGFSASRRTDKRGYAFFGNIHIYIKKRLVFAVPKAKVFY